MNDVRKRNKMNIVVNYRSCEECTSVSDHLKLDMQDLEQ